MGFGDSVTASLNGGVIGSEVRTNALLKLQSRQSSVMQLWIEIQSPTYVRFGRIATNIVFDRSRRATAEPGLQLDNSAYRKIMPKYARIEDNFSNWNSFPAYWFNQALPQDLNGDGVQDTMSWEGLNAETFSIYGTNAPGVSVRPVGVGASIRGVNQVIRELSYVHLPSGRYRLWDYSFRNEMEPNETYGLSGSETGLEIKTDPERIANSSTWLATFDSVTYTGSRYNIQAVPEPSSLFALGMGLVFLRRRR
jgi:hypothetical protein